MIKNKGFLYMDTSSTFTTKALKTTLSEIVMHEVPRCIQCHRCLDACPVSKQEISIPLLNQALTQTSQVPTPVKDFIFSCVQCSRCVPVCPVGLHRDQMILFLKMKLQDQQPWCYK